jgi:hypothetical protein
MVDVHQGVAVDVRYGGTRKPLRCKMERCDKRYEMIEGRLTSDACVSYGER